MQKPTNRLAQQSSPYLLQHAHNPVDWYPWGNEAFELARKHDRPIFLSVGYSTCYWCHVMERESFENERVAEVMNRRFVNIKVDREEHPDVDQFYMTFVQLLTGQGGWPMSVFLLPDGRPFFGGTYFPPEDGHGRPGFMTVLRAIDDAFRSRRAEIESSASELLEAMRRASAVWPGSGVLDSQQLDEWLRRSTSDFDHRWGGFGGAPKFPRQTLLNLMLTRIEQGPDDELSQRLAGMLARTLDAMAQGGIRDHLAGGFHRYATDARWRIPHFEIMLYDNAMLARIYARASRLPGRAGDAKIARGVLDFVLRELRDTGGAFHSALDAEANAREGLTYLWTPDEVKSLLPSDLAGPFCAAYGLDEGFNFADPHHGDGTEYANVLYLAKPEMEDDPRIVKAREMLLQARRERPQPRKDDKVLTAWNGLMIRALADSATILGEPGYVQAASEAATFLLRVHRDASGRLLRTSRGGVASLPATLDDYAFLADGLLALGDATADPSWKATAADLVEILLRDFADESTGALYFTDASATDLPFRQVLVGDSPLASGNAVAASVLLRLGRKADAGRILRALSGQMAAFPHGMSSMIESAMLSMGGEGSPKIGEPVRSMGPKVGTPGAPIRVEVTWPSGCECRIGVYPGAGWTFPRTSDGASPPRLLAGGSAGNVSVETVRLGETEAVFVVTPDPTQAGQFEMELFFQLCGGGTCLPEQKQVILITPGGEIRST
jgi:uncharacterized protein YyaL (SSP411 family)